LLHAYVADANFKLMHTLSYVTSVQPLARAPYVVLFKPLNKATGRHVCTACMHAWKGEQEHTSEHV